MTDVVEYMEARRLRRNRAVAWIVGLTIVIGGAGYAIHASGAKERERNDRTQELITALHD